MPEAKGPRMYTLIRTAKLNGIEPEAYLREVLTRIGEHPINAIDALLPWNIFRTATLSVAAWQASVSRHSRADHATLTRSLHIIKQTKRENK